MSYDIAALKDTLIKLLTLDEYQRSQMKVLSILQIVKVSLGFLV